MLSALSSGSIVVCWTMFSYSLRMKEPPSPSNVALGQRIKQARAAMREQISQSGFAKAELLSAQLQAALLSARTGRK